jgi:hypothetical protein
MQMRTFTGDPNLLVRFNPPIGNIPHIRFNDKGEFTTGNERVIQRLMHKFDSVPVTIKQTTQVEMNVSEQETQVEMPLLEQDVSKEGKTYTCKLCEFTTDNRVLLMQHYKIHKGG